MMLEEDPQSEGIIARVVALDIGKADLMCCIRIPGETGSGRRLQEVRPYSTMTRSLVVMADRLAQLKVTRVVMEAPRSTGNRCFICWRPTGLRLGWSTPAM
jgi:hypothetical protein